jgi:hypothetical protein
MVSSVGSRSKLLDHSIHLAAWALLKTSSPARAHALILRIGGLFPRIAQREDVLRSLRTMGPYGSCLSRALAVAARTPNADVVIGVDHRKDRPLFAHAWVEMNGVAVDMTDVAGEVIARLRGPDV